MKTVLVTGIGRGIGKAVAKRFLDDGYLVIGTTRSSGVPFKHENLKTFELDLSKPDSIENFDASIANSGTKIDILVNNSGALFDDDETVLVPDKLRKTLEVNLIGTADLTEKMLPNMNRPSHIVNISSAAGSISDMDDISTSHHPHYYPAYKISKAALNMYARTLAARVESDGIIVSSIHPGWVKTDMGGEDAPVTPEEAAKDIFELAISKPETGQFWYKGKKYPW